MEDCKIKVKKADFKASSVTPYTTNPGFYCIITQEVMQDKDLSASEKLMYGLITSLCHVKGYCWANNGFFEQHFGKGNSTVRMWLNNLKAKNYISIEYIIDEETNEQLERHIYPMMNIELLQRLAKNSIIGKK